VARHLSIGDAILEITGIPHNGCAKFVDRFGADAVRFVNSPTGKQLHLRGIYAKVVRDGQVRVGDAVTKR
jgi:MOSC domain-containing protein YiiM